MDLRDIHQLSKGFASKVSAVLKHAYFIPSLYTIGGIGLFSVFFMMLYAHVFHMKVETAVVIVPLEAMVSPVSGYVNALYVLQGAKVSKGTPLISIFNIELERDKQLAETDAESLAVQYQYLKTLVDNESLRLKVYEHVGQDRKSSLKASVQMAEADYDHTRKNLARMQQLYNKHYISKATYDSESAKFKVAKSNLDHMTSQAALEAHASLAMQHGFYFTGNKIEGVQKDLIAQLALTHKQWQIAKKKVAVYKALMDKLTLRAPFHGKVVQILKSAGATTENNKPLLILENTQADKQVAAYLTQDEIVKAAYGGTVKIVVPSLNKTFVAIISDINRTDGFVDVMKAQFRPRDLQLDRSAMVTFTLSQKDQKAFNQRAHAGLPAVVYFPRRFSLW